MGITLKSTQNKTNKPSTLILSLEQLKKSVYHSFIGWVTISTLAQHELSFVYQPLNHHLGLP